MSTATLNYDGERYGHLDKGILVEVGTIIVNEHGEPCHTDGSWYFAWPKYGYSQRTVGGEIRLAGYTLAELRDIAAVHGNVVVEPGATPPGPWRDPNSSWDTASYILPQRDDNAS